MNVSLTAELEEMVNDKVKSGLYQTASEVVREALRLLKERDEDRSQLRADLRVGLGQLARSEGRTFTTASSKTLAAEVKARGRKRSLRA
jgi:antitoxin ParD1/3/4